MKTPPIEMLNDAQRESFFEHGFCHVSGLLDAEIVRAARAMVERGLERAASRVPPGTPVERWGMATRMTQQAVRALRQTPEIAALERSELIAIAEVLCAGPVWRVTARPQLLVTPRNGESWYVPHDAWHTDTPRLTGNPLPGVQAFLLLSDVLPEGGGTLVVAGSHRLPPGGRFLRSRKVKAALRRYEWFRDLLGRERSRDSRRFMDEPWQIAGVEVWVKELAGAAGDVYFTDLRLLHAPAVNARPAARVMATQRYPSRRHFSRHFVPLEKIGEGPQQPA